MSDYIDLNFDIFDLPRQRARVLRNLLVKDLLDEILKEFTELDREIVEGYALRMKSQHANLDKDKSLVELGLQNQDEIELIYTQTGRRRIPANDRAALKELSRSEVFEINSQPAIIGRPDASDPMHNLLLAVNLKNHINGQYASRNHAQITYSNGDYYLEAKSKSHPTYLNQLSTTVTQKTKLQDGDRIIIGNNRITLQFIRHPQKAED
jgi:hypothetical protein